MSSRFKRPQEYDPLLAEKTLQTQQTLKQKNKRLLMELGLEDEGLGPDDVDNGLDEEEEGDGEGEDEQYADVNMHAEVAALKHTVRKLEQKVGALTSENQVLLTQISQAQQQSRLTDGDADGVALLRQVEKLPSDRASDGDAALQRQVRELRAENQSLRKAAAASGNEQAASLAAHVQRLEGQLAERDHQVASLQKQIKAAESIAAASTAASVDSSSNTDAARKQLAGKTAKYEAQIAELMERLTVSEREASQLKARLQTNNSTSKQLGTLYSQIDGLHGMREAILAELVAMKTELFDPKAMQQMVRAVEEREVGAMRKAKSESQGEVAQALRRAAEAEAQLATVEERYRREAEQRERETSGLIQHLQDKWRAEFDKRKKLHNLVLELKGNIRVLCRVRPLVEKERSVSDAELPVCCLTSDLIRLEMERGEKEFEFDRVFSPVEGQEVVFDEVGGLVTSVLDGYNVSIVAYGQTGSGKTHTMEGPQSDPGVNVRALRELFRLAAERGEDWEYVLSASILEIYNEQIFDLLSGSKESDDKLDVKQGPEGMYVPGLIAEQVSNMEEVMNVINTGKSNRSTFATNMNEHSSRSHLVLSVYVSAVNRSTGVGLRGKLHLIDLAGSERLSRTGAQGDRLKEAQNINKSLSALGDVIQALQEKKQHIPYRNSKLTRLLEDSLGGNNKCIMVVNVSPAGENINETKCSLEFASRARKVELGQAKQNVETGGGSAPNSAPGSPTINRIGSMPASRSSPDVRGTSSPSHAKGPSSLRPK